MARTVEDLRPDLLALDDEERLMLAEELMASLPVSPEWQREWLAEAERRAEELKAGSVRALSREEFMSNDD